MKLPVDVVIACHNAKRPINRAVRSVIVGNGEVARAVVVCHNLPAAEIQQVIDPEIRDQVNYLECLDGIGSPAGPFNYGIAESSATWVMVMGSDDELQPGTVAALLSQADGADAVIIRSQLAGKTVPTPPVRVLPWQWRDVVKDRLLYRAAPLGLLRREFLQQHRITFTPDIRVGEDLEFSLELWSQGRIKVQRRGPGYQINDDATDRMTMRLAPASDELRHCEIVWQNPLLSENLQLVEALALKYLRVNFFSFAYLRATQGQWSTADRALLAHWVNEIVDRAPQCLKIMSIADVRLIRALADPDVPEAELNKLALARRRFGAPATLIPADIRYIFHREAPLRFMSASLLKQLMR